MLKGLKVEDFEVDTKTFDAVVRNLEIIGEASGKIPDVIKDTNPEIEWARIISMRNKMIKELKY